MEDVQRRDRKLLQKELLRPWPLCLSAGALLFILQFGFLDFIFGDIGVWRFVFAAIIPLWHFGAAWNRAYKKRFKHRRYQVLWEACEDRLKRFHEALSNMKKRRIAEFSELPKTIKGVGENLYFALRRADIVFDEICSSEGWLQGQQNVTSSLAPSDPQAQELYRVADKNIAEYKKHYSAVMAGVQRAEAQAHVFTTTLDTLRMKMLGYRLTGRKPELSTQEFLESLTEAKMQLDAIDKALDELELTPFPKMISILPPESTQTAEHLHQSQ